MAASGVPVQVVHGYALDAKEARSFAKRLWNLSPDELAPQPGVPARRLSTIPAAALVLDRLLKRLQPERVVFSALGLREGWLYAQLSEAERDLDPLVEGAQIVGLAGARVPAFGAALARWTDALFPDESPAEHRLRLAACALTDIAWRSHTDVQAEESFHRLLQFPFIGIDHLERVYLAAVVHARYGGGSGDPATASALALLSSAQRRRARVLGRTLRLAHRLSGCVGAILETASLHVEAGRVRLEIRSSAGIPDSDTLKSRLQDLAKTLRSRTPRSWRSAENVPRRVTVLRPQLPADRECRIARADPRHDARHRVAAGEPVYAHPQNAFWRIAGTTLGFDSASPYAVRVALLRAAGIAVWDVLKSCTRQGSLDSDIVHATALPNDLPAFLGAIRISAGSASTAPRPRPFTRDTCGRISWAATTSIMSACRPPARRMRRCRSQANCRHGRRSCCEVTHRRDPPRATSFDPGSFRG